jgi:hypothetical protein
MRLKITSNIGNNNPSLFSDAFLNMSLVEFKIGLDSDVGEWYGTAQSVIK